MNPPSWPMVCAMLAGFMVVRPICVAGARVALGVSEREASQPDVDARDGAIHTPDLVARTRDGKGALTRSQARRRTFMRATGFPKGRPGYVVDHIVPLACGGADIPSNYAWQSETQGRAKDRWELDCRRWADGTYLRLLQSAIDADGRRIR